MKKLDLQKIIREEVKKSLNETYRDAKENVDIIYAMLKKGGKEAQYVKTLFKDIKSELNVIMSPNDAKATLNLVNKIPELETYLDSAVEDALDDGMGRARGMMGSMQGMREVVATKDDLDKIGDFIMSSPTFEFASPSKIKSAIKDMNNEWKASARNYKSIEEYFEEMEEMGDEEAFMEGKKPSKKKKSLKEGYAWERGERKFGEPLPTLASIQAAHQAKYNITEESLTEAKFQKGDTVIPLVGPHKGIPHKVIAVLNNIDSPGDDIYNIQPIGLQASKIKYRLGAAGATASDLEKA